jgi:hypothetical protein
MSLWKLRFALEYCRKASMSKADKQRDILNCYRRSRLHILIRKHWRRFEIHKPLPLILVYTRGMIFDSQLNLINLG